jgi:predicted dehydrogenase
MAAEVRIAIVGMGIGKQNGNAFVNDPRCRVTALCDLKEDAMAAYAKTLPDEVTCYTDYKAMCKSSEVDAVFVGTPNQWHVPVAMEAIKRDKHVMITKPLADQASTARKLVQAAEASGLVNMMSLSTRYSNGVMHLGRMAKRGDFGELYYGRARSIRRSGIPDWSLGFIQDGGGAFRDMGVHVLDSAWWLMGRPEAVSITGVSGAKMGPVGKGYWDFRRPEKDFYQQFATDDYGGGFIRFADGSGLQIESFWASHQPNELNVELFGTEAGATLKPLTVYRTTDGVPENVEIAIPSKVTPWDHIAAHFAECILDGKECDAPLRDGLVIQEMLEGLLKSAKTGREVKLAGK